MFSLLLSSCCSKEDGQHSEPAAGNGTPVQMNATTTATKGTINTLDDLIGDGFVVWASWTKDTADDSIFSGDYESGTNPAVFGTDGTKVYAEDGNSDGHFTPVATAADKWNYAPTQYWHRGTYTFAAVLPASGFAADFDMNSTAGAAEPPYTATLSVSQTGTTSSPTLTLDFGTSGFNLSTEQTDLMVAFDTDIDGNLLAPVSFSFSHQLARIRFEASATDKTIDISNIKLTSYKNKAKSVEFKRGTSDKDIIQTWIFDEPGESNHDNGNTGWGLTTESQDLFEWLVFPQNANDVKIVITYVEHFDGESENNKQRVTKTIEATIPEVIWQPYNTYLYRFTVTADRIKFAEPSVEGWNDIEDTFPNPVM